MTKDQIINHVLTLEGGFVEHKNDKGGPTNFGITLNTLQSFKKNYDLQASDVRSLTQNDAVEIYDKDYWQVMNLDKIHFPEVQLAIFSTGVNRGPYSAVRIAQFVANMKTPKGLIPLLLDGEMGPKTYTAINNCPPSWFFRNYQQACQIEYVRIVKQNTSQLVFLEGWLRRLQLTEDFVAESGVIA